MATLRSTMTPPELSPSADSKPLLAFVDEAALAAITAALHASIDRYKETADDFADVGTLFDADLARLQSAVDLLPDLRSPSAAPSPLPSCLQVLTDHASEMADLVQGLVRHYDRCVSAIKRTDGAGDAALETTMRQQQQQQQHEHTDERQDAEADTELTRSIQDSPSLMSDEERAEMLAVLAHDAGEVDDVVAEIRNRGIDMEAELDTVQLQTKLLRDEDAALVAIVQQLQQLRVRLPALFKRSTDFLAHWQAERTRIHDKLDELDALRLFYHAFLRAYDGLLVEVGRRRNVQVRMEQLVRAAMGQIKQLYQGECWHETPVEK